MLSYLPTPGDQNIINMTATHLHAQKNPKKKLHRFKKFFKVNFPTPKMFICALLRSDIKKFICAQLGIIKNRWGFLPSKISHFLTLKKRLNFYIFFL